VSIGELVTGGIRLCQRPIRIVLIDLIVIFPVIIALKVIEQMFEHDESLSQIPDGRQGFAVCCSHDPVGHIHHPVDIIDIVSAKL
jgi:hypothetical protein